MSRQRAQGRSGSRWAGWFESERNLSRLVFFLPLAAYVAIYFVDGTAFHPSGDGYYSWIFTRSLAFDGDLELRNDYALCGDPFHVGVDRGTGHLDDPFYIGPTFFWLVPLTLVRGLATLFLGVAGAAKDSCGGWTTALTILMGPLCGAASIWLAYRAARLVAAAPAAAFAALLFAFTSPLFPYSTSVAHYSHVYMTCLVGALTYVSLRIVVLGYRRGDALWIASTLALAILHRAPAGLYAVIVVPPFLAVARHADRARLAAAVAGGCAAGAGVTAALYQYLYGTWRTLPQGPYYVHLDHSHPWLLLFGIHGGFFFWMPAAWLGVAGLAMAIGRPRIRWFALFCLVASAAEAVVSSSALDWHGSWSLGARRLVPLTPFVVIFASIAIERALAAVRLAPVWALRLAAGTLLLVLVNNIPAATTIRGDEELTQRQLYGAWSPFRPLWAALDALGPFDVAVLPGEAYFAARYGLPLRSYREVLKSRFVRSYRDLTFVKSRFDLRQPAMALLYSGSWSAEQGLEVTGRTNDLVIAAEWPFATHVRVMVAGDPGVRVSVGLRGGFGAPTPAGTVVVPPEGATPGWVELEVPPGVFDSGLGDWTFSAEGGRASVSAFELEDLTPRVPFGALDPGGPPPT